MHFHAINMAPTFGHLKYAKLKNASSRSNFSLGNNNELTLSWHNINVNFEPKNKFSLFHKSPKKDVRCILRNVNGKIRRGQLLAIMGASGAGKTSLLNVLTNRNLHTLQVTGDLKLNGCVIKDELKQYSAYVQQDDLLCGSLTVREHLTFQVMLRVNPHFGYGNKEKVEDIIREFGLSNSADTKIGVPGSIQGISGGERKRLAFASEILSDPAILFCDEPTSGLDSFISKSVVSVLKKLAEKGRSVVFTVHQPSSEVYEMFDNILLMAEGRIAYMGDRVGVATHFENVGLPVPIKCNEAEHIIHSMAIIPGYVEECKQRAERICDAFDWMDSAMENNVAELRIENDEVLVCTSRYIAPWCTQMRMLMWRFSLETTREMSVTISRVCFPLLVAVLLGVIFFRQELTQKGIANINGAMFVMLMQLIRRGYTLTVNEFCSHMPLLLREYGNGLYRTDAYFLSKTLVDLPVVVMISVSCCTVLYWMIGLRPDVSAFLYCLLIIFLASNIGASFGYFVSCLSNSVSTALSFGQTSLVLFTIFGGYFVRNDSIPWCVAWIQYIAWYSYANQMLVINQWGPIKNITCEQSAVTCLYDGKAIIESFGFNESAFYSNIVKLVALLFFYRLLAFILLHVRARRKS